MSELNEIPDTPEIESEGTNSLVKVLSILSFVGNGFWLLASLIVLVMVFANVGDFVELLPTNDSGDAFIGILAFSLLVVMALCIISFIGASKMYKGEKSGFRYYLIGEGLWATLIFLGNNGVFAYILLGIISVGFIIGFYTQLKSLN